MNPHWRGNSYYLRLRCAICDHFCSGFGTNFHSHFPLHVQEVLITEFLPHIKSEAGIDVASTTANILGGYLEGLLYGIERQSARHETQQLCTMIRCYFLNVFTSFPFVATHAAEMAVLNGPGMALGYIITSLALAVAAFEAGRRPTETFLAEARFQPMHWTNTMGSNANRQRILMGLFIIVLLGLLKGRYVLASSVVFGGDAQPDMAHTFAMLVGIILAISGAALGGLIQSCMRANFTSCLFVGLAFGARRVLAWDRVATTLWTIAFSKFVGSFCGAFSGFAKMLSDAGKLMHDELKPRDAFLEIFGNIGIAVMWAGIFYAFDRQGLDVYSHAGGFHMISFSDTDTSPQ
eukprot:m.219358 g.219358  ORF g.219358 m.219358 type:complete len:349 (-) comp15580_c0_seq1:6464-7510(-)